MSARYSGLCSQCGNRRPIRRDGTIGVHEGRGAAAAGPCDPGLPIEGSERCNVCHGRRSGEPPLPPRGAIQHATDCAQRRTEPPVPVLRGGR